MRVAVYSIALNEEANVEGWLDSAHGADLALVLDTGSTDRTVQTLSDLGPRIGPPVHVQRATVSPWRFDVARNAALALVPADIDVCIALDLDERLQPGWREALEAMPEHVTRPRYRYVWSWREDGTPDLTYGGDKVHRRHGFRWTGLVHETLVGLNVVDWLPGFEVHHRPDPGKSRGQYLPLLEQAVAEDPGNDRNVHYLGRELVYAGRGDDAVPVLRRHLAMPSATYAAERAATMRLLAQCLPYEAESWLLRACAEAPQYRENWLALARLYEFNGMWTEMAGALQRGLFRPGHERPMEYLTTSEAWDDDLWHRLLEQAREGMGA